MTIKELIEELKQFNENMPVVRVDNRGGYENINLIYQKEIHDNFKTDDKDFPAIILD